jgi:hypothetical protein
LLPNVFLAPSLDICLDEPNSQAVRSFYTGA